MFRRFFPGFLLAALLLPGPLFGQVQILGKILGTIRVGSGEFPQHPIMVELFFRGAPIDSTYADGQGVFSFFNLAPNGYHIVIRDEAYQPVDELANVNPALSTVSTLHIVLRSRETAKKEDPLSPRASGGNPYMVDQADYNQRFSRKALKEFQRGVEAERKAKPEEAITHYLSALKIAPDYYPAHNNLGSLYLGKADYKSAEEQFRETVRLDQNDAQGYFNLGNVLMLTGRFPESGSVLSSGLQRRPDSAFGHFLEGCLFSRTANPVEAEKNLRESLRLDATMWQAHLQLVNLYLQQGQKQNAITQLQAFLQAFPSVPAGPKAKQLLQKLQNESD